MADDRHARRDRATPEPAHGVEALRAQLLARAMRRRRAVGPVTSGFGPQQFDESGFPIPQRAPVLAERVRRLLAG